MSKNQKRVYIFSAGVIVLLALLIYMRVRSNAEEAAKVTRPVPSVQVSQAQVGTISRTLTFSGDIAAIQESSIFPRVNGNIEKEFVDIGDYVREGQILALIDTTVYAENARQARAAFLQAQATLANSKLIYERDKSLLEQNLIAKQDLDNAETAYKVAGAQAEAASANYRNAVTQLGYCRITAPFSGFVTRRFFDPGTYVTASTNSQTSTLFYLADISKVKIMVDLLERDVPLIGKIKDAEIVVDAYPDQVFHGRITRVSQQLDLATRTMPVEVDVDNPQRLLKPGMYATVNLLIAKADNAVILPSQVIMRDDSGYYVYTVTKDNTVHKSYVKVGIAQDNRDEILSGISRNDEIVFLGQDLVNDGMKVRVTR